MSLTFTKLCSSITESTIWLEPAPTRLVWITMLAMADKNGLVFGSAPGLAHKARVEIEDCRRALETFLSPDPDSSTKEHDGRRIAEVDGGWEILNHAKYRAIQTVEAIKESKKNYMRRMRASNVHKVPQTSTVEKSGSSPLPLDLTLSNPDPERARAEPKRKRPTPWPEDFRPNANHAALALKHQVDLAEQLELCADHWRSNGELKANWDATFSNWLRRARSFAPNGQPQTAQKAHDEPSKWRR